MKIEITDEMREIIWGSFGKDVDGRINELAPLIIAQYEAQLKSRPAKPVAPVVSEGWTITMDTHVQYRDGKPARLLAIDIPNAKPIISFHENGLCYGHYPDGSIGATQGESCFDLIPLQKPRIKHGGWVNAYPNKNVYGLFSTKEEADVLARKDRTECVYIEFEEGEGL
jgi:hypothetical protein